MAWRHYSSNSLIDFARAWTSEGVRVCTFELLILLVNPKSAEQNGELFAPGMSLSYNYHWNSLILNCKCHTQWELADNKSFPAMDGTQLISIVVFLNSLVSMNKERLWKVKVKVVPIVLGALGTVTNKLNSYLKEIGVNVTIQLIQKSALLGTARILRKVLDV